MASVNQFPTMVEALNSLQAQGFQYSFVCSDEGLKCVETKQVFQPEEMTIVCYHRFEGAKDMGDVSVVYVVEAGPDVRGVLVDAYGTYADDQLGAYIKRMPIAQGGAAD